MRHSRYITLLVIITICFAGMVWWFSPQRIITVLANPHYAFTPRATVQHFWNLLDLRQVNLAEELLDLESEQNRNELTKWKKTVENNPLLSLQKLEIIEEENVESIIVRVTWGTSLKEELTESYIFNLQKVENSWLIREFKRVKEFSYWG